MRPFFTAARFLEAGQVLWRQRSLKAAERLPRAELEALQQRKLRRLLDIARRKSPYYARILSKLPENPRLEDLPVLTKEMRRENFDDIVTDRRLKYEDIDRFIMSLDKNEAYMGEFRVLFTSGTTGERGATVYGPHDWSLSKALMIRSRTLAGIGTPLLSRRRTATVGAPGAAAAGRQWGVNMRNPLNPLYLVSTDQPLPGIVSQLQAFQPEVLSSDPNVLFVLAREQLEGRLSIAPRTIWCSSEVLSPAIKDTIFTAWKTAPFDAYGTTETGMFAASCERKQGMHLYEDCFIFEVVDENYRAVAPGVAGRRILVTNLYNETQPQIRYELTDHVTLAPEPCPCGRTLQLVSEVSGREAEVLFLPGSDGGETAVLPFHLVKLPRFAPGCLQSQIIYEKGILQVLLVLAQHGDPESVQLDARNYVEEALTKLGANVPPVTTKIVDELLRQPNGKTLLVINRDSHRGVAS